MNYKKHLHVGPGGMDCACCFDAPGSKSRKAEFRKAKKKERRDAINDALLEMEENSIDESMPDDYIFMDHD